MELYTKDMVSPRCEMAVKKILKKMGIEYIKMELGSVTLKIYTEEA